MKKLIIFLILFPSVLFSQGENNNWLTGWGWVNFNNYQNGKPEFIFKELYEFSFVNPIVSDSEGNLLFYADGGKVYNKKHDIMFNGSYNTKFMSLTGSKSRYNLSTVIVPHRSDENLYYIFQTTKDPFIKYCLIDISLDNGLGSLILRDTINTEHLISGLATTLHSNGRDVWLVAKADKEEDDTEFNISSFLIDSDSIHTKPVISTYEIKYRSFATKSFNIVKISGGRNQLRISKDGNYLGFCYFGNNGIFLFRYDNKTGKASKGLEFFDSFLFENINGNFEFSFDSKLLFTQRYSFDISTWDTTSIRESRKEYIAKYYPNLCTSMQLGTDNKIYLLWKRDDIINNFDTLKVYIINKLNKEVGLDSLNWFIGDILQFNDFPWLTSFPHLVVPRLNFNAEILGNSIYCVGDTLLLRARIVQDSMQAERYRWNRSTLQDSVIEIGPLGINDGGWYTATCYYMDIPRTDSIFIKILPNPEFYIKSTDYSPCEGDTITLSASDNFKKYLWNDGDTNVTKTTTETGIYSLTVTNEAGCEGTMDIEINFGKAPELAILGDTIICPGNKAKLEAQSEPENQIKWSTGSNKNIIEVDSGSYWVMATSPAGCKKIDTVHVSYSPLTEVKIALDGDPVICKGSRIILKSDPESTEYIYSWSNGETTPQIEIENGGYYWVEVTDENGCTGYSDTVEITEADPPNPVIAGKNEICKGEIVELSTEQEFTSYQWSNGETTRNINISTAGKYYVNVSYENGCTGTDSIEINEIEINISGLNDIDFGEINIDQEGSTSLIAVNNSNQTITIESIYFKGNLSEFTFTTTPTLPNTFNTGENLTIDIKFLPNFERLFTDSLILEISDPCVIKKSISISGKGSRNNARLVLTLPDLIGRVGNSNFHIPLYARVENHPDIQNANISGEIIFSSELFLPESLTDGILKGTPIENSQRKVQFVIADVGISSNDKEVTEIVGTVLLGNIFETPLTLENFNININIPVVKHPGSLKVDSLCLIGISGVVLFQNAEMSIAPNPITEKTEINLKYSLPGQYRFELYSVDGRLIDKHEWYNSISGTTIEKTIKPDLKSYSQGLYRAVLYSQGLYRAVLRNPAEVVTKIMMVMD